MFNIIHFHPSLQMAKRFVKPLVNMERKNDFNSKIISTELDFENRENLNFNFKISLFNILFFPFKLIQICFFIRRLNPKIIISHNSSMIVSHHSSIVINPLIIIHQSSSVTIHQ